MLIAPTPDRDALYIYRSIIPLDYLESFADVHKPLESEIRRCRVIIPFYDTAILLETLGQILDAHGRLEAAAHNMMIMEKENPSQKHPIDSEHDRDSIKRQRHSTLPLAETVALDSISRG